MGQKNFFDDNSNGYNSNCDSEHVAVGADEPTSMSSITLTDGDEGTDTAGDHSGEKIVNNLNLVQQLLDHQ